MSIPAEILVLGLIGSYAAYRNAPTWAACAVAAALALGLQLLWH